MAGGADDQKVGMEFSSEDDDVAHGMAGENMGHDLDALLLRQTFGARRKMGRSRRSASRFSFFTSPIVSGKLQDLLDANDVKHGAGLLGQAHREGASFVGSFRAVIGMKNDLENISIARLDNCGHQSGARDTAGSANRPAPGSLVGSGLGKR